MTNPTIPADLIAALPSGISLETCTTTTYGDLCAAHDSVEPRQRYADIADDALVVVLPGWAAYDGHGDVVDYPDESREDAAREYVDGGEWNATETTWIEVTTWQRAYVLDVDGDVVELRVDADWHSITLDPDEPECVADEHDWQSPHEVVGGLAENPGVYGHGGGVIITEVCAHCGRYRVRDTWAQNRTNGVQGLESVEYRNADDASSEWIAKRQEGAAA